MDPFGTAQTATAGALGFDCDVPLTSPEIMSFAAAGFTWAARYLSRGEEASHDLQAVEVHALHTSGLSVVSVQHVAAPGWVASVALGHTLGREAASNASQIGCPLGVTLWLDLEGVTPGFKEIVGFCNAWSAEVTAGGFSDGLYVGANCGLNSSQLYRMLTVSRYWRSLSRTAPSVDVRGFQIVQSLGAMIDDVQYDKDYIKKDNLNGLPIWWAPS